MLGTVVHYVEADGEHVEMIVRQGDGKLFRLSRESASPTFMEDGTWVRTHEYRVGVKRDERSKKPGTYHLPEKE